MRTKFGPRSAAAGVLALGVVMSGPGVANAGDDHHKKHLRLVGTEIQEQMLDLGTPGVSLGDQLIFSERLTYRGREVGVSGAVCTVTQAVPPYGVVMNHCVGTLSLRKGQITLQGLIEVQGLDDPGPFTVAITGGTGKFRGASGEAIVRNVSPTRRVYKLRFDSRKHRHKH